MKDKRHRLAIWPSFASTAIPDPIRDVSVTTPSRLNFAHTARRGVRKSRSRACPCTDASRQRTAAPRRGIFRTDQPSLRLRATRLNRYRSCRAGGHDHSCSPIRRRTTSERDPLALLVSQLSSMRIANLTGPHPTPRSARFSPPAAHVEPVRRETPRRESCRSPVECATSRHRSRRPRLRGAVHPGREHAFSTRKKPIAFTRSSWPRSRTGRIGSRSIRQSAAAMSEGDRDTRLIRREGHRRGVGAERVHEGMKRVGARPDRSASGCAQEAEEPAAGRIREPERVIENVFGQRPRPFEIAGSVRLGRSHRATRRARESHGPRMRPSTGEMAMVSEYCQWLYSSSITIRPVATSQTHPPWLEHPDDVLPIRMERRQARGVLRLDSLRTIRPVLASQSQTHLISRPSWR